MKAVPFNWYGFSRMDQEWVNAFRVKLDQHHDWPSVYIFKFIVPIGKEVELKSLFPMHTTTDKLSTQGNYISVTFQMMMHSSNAVIEVYERVSKIEGLIAL